MSATAPGALSRTDRFLAGVERAGNRLPDPFILFAWLFAIIAVVSTVMALADVSVTIPGADDETVVRGFFTGEGLTWLTTTVVANFIEFPPLGTVLTILLAVTVAERTGLLSAMIRRSLGSAPRWALPYAVAFVGTTAHVMSDASFIVIPPLAAMVFKAAGRHPVAGLVGGFAAVGAGYSTSTVPTSLDALFAGITNSVTGALPDPGATVTPISNYFFNLAASIVLTLVAGFLIDRVLEPRLTREGVPTEQRPDDSAGDLVSDDEETAEALRSTPEPTTAVLEPHERRGMRAALLVGAVIVVAMAVAFTVPGSPWRNEDGGYLPESPLLSSIVFIVFVLFVVPGIVYGFVSGSLRRGSDVPKVIGLGVKDMSSFIVLAFMLGQFIALFNWTGIGSVIAVGGADALESVGLTGFVAVIGFILLASVLNLFIISGSSLWTLMASVFVPLFAILGFEPGFTQAAFRIGDSATQIITPLNPYIYVLLLLVRRYEPEAGLGTIISRTLPFVAPFWLAWAAVLAVFYFTGTDLGPGVGIRL